MTNEAAVSAIQDILDRAQDPSAILLAIDQSRCQRQQERETSEVFFRFVQARPRFVVVAPWSWKISFLTNDLVNDPRNQVTTALATQLNLLMPEILNATKAGRSEDRSGISGQYPG